MVSFPYHLGVSENNGTPRSSILIGFSIINHPFWGTPIFGNTNIFRESSAWERLWNSLESTRGVRKVRNGLEMCGCWLLGGFVDGEKWVGMNG